MSKRERDREVEECAHELRLEHGRSLVLAHLVSDVSYTSGLQLVSPVASSPAHGPEHPLFKGLSSTKAVSLPLFPDSYRADWRVLVVVVLAVSNPTNFLPCVPRRPGGPTRDGAAFLARGRRIDIANEEISLYLCLILSGIFGGIVLKDVFDDKKNQQASGKEWSALRKLALGKVLARKMPRVETWSAL